MAAITICSDVGTPKIKSDTASPSISHEVMGPDAIIFVSWAINLALVNSKKLEIIPSIFSDHSAVRLDIYYRRKAIKNANTWRLNNTLLNNQQITEEIKKEIKKCIETNENENTMTQNLWDTVKAVLRGKFIAIQAYLKKQEKSQINNLTLHIKQLEKEEMENPRVSRRKEILKLGQK